MIELLAPAGDLNRLKIALLYGADAIYLGGEKYSLRANATNFTLEEIKEAVSYAHERNKKIYVTVNIILHNEDLEGLREYLLALDTIGIDAIIASDISVIRLSKELNCNFEVHISTQASILNTKSALFYKKLGATRLVLAREASKEDIKAIKKVTNLELECFVHGAMCTSLSGRCVLSNYCTNRDANRGSCAQICRWTFHTELTDHPFSMTPKDLNMVSYIDEMINIGVSSLKVEGRMRGIYYVATVIKTYREIIDEIKNHTLTEGLKKYHLDILNRCANRESTPQFFKNLPTEKEQYFLGRDEVSNQDFLGIVIAYDEKNKKVLLEQRNLFKIGDTVEFFGPNMETFTYKIHKIENEEKEKIEVANHPRMLVYLEVKEQLHPYDMMRIKVFDKQDYL